MVRIESAQMSSLGTRSEREKTILHLCFCPCVISPRDDGIEACGIVLNALCTYRSSRMASGLEALTFSRTLVGWVKFQETSVEIWRANLQAVLLKPQGYKWIDLRRASRRDITSQQCHQTQDEGYGCEGDNIPRRHAEQESRHQSS
jgi:hypothetical protein